MDTNVLVAAITVLGSALAAAGTYLLTKRSEASAEWRKRKIEHYQRLLLAISDLAADNVSVEAYRDFAAAFNTICLVAPQRVVRALVEFHDAIAVQKRNLPKEEHDRLLIVLMLAIREDIGVSPSDAPSTFAFHLTGQPGRNPK